MEKKNKFLNGLAIIFFILTIFWHPQNMILQTIMGVLWVIVIAYYLVTIIRKVITKDTSLK